MNTNNENIPTRVFDYLQVYGFEQLNRLQQEEVLTYISHEEYEQMHEAALSIKKLQRANNPKEMLMQRFDERYPKEAKLIPLQSPLIWKAAAVFFFFGLIYMQYLLMNTNKPLATSLASVKDTIFIVKNLVSDPLKIHDTVYISYAAPAKRHREPGPGDYRDESKLQQDNTATAHYQELNIHTIKELNSAANRKKGRSIKDDSLLNSFDFVKL